MASWIQDEKISREKLKQIPLSEYRDLLAIFIANSARCISKIIFSSIHVFVSRDRWHDYFVFLINFSLCLDFHVAFKWPKMGREICRKGKRKGNMSLEMKHVLGTIVTRLSDKVIYNNNKRARDSARQRGETRRNILIFMRLMHRVA